MTLYGASEAKTLICSRRFPSLRLTHPTLRCPGSVSHVSLLLETCRPAPAEGGRAGLSSAKHWLLVESVVGELDKKPTRGVMVSQAT